MYTSFQIKVVKWDVSHGISTEEKHQLELQTEALGKQLFSKMIKDQNIFCRRLTANPKLAKSTSQQLVFSRLKSWQEFASLAKSLITVKLIIRYTQR